MDGACVNTSSVFVSASAERSVWRVYVLNSGCYEPCGRALETKEEATKLLGQLRAAHPDHHYGVKAARDYLH